MVSVLNIHAAFIRYKNMCLNYDRKCNEYERKQRQNNTDKMKKKTKNK